MALTHSTGLVHTMLAAGLACAAFGCGEAPKPLGDGSLEVTWQVSPRGCEQANVETVDVKLSNAHRSYAGSYACSDSEALLDNLTPATYELEVVGLDPSGRQTFVADKTLVTVCAEKKNDAPHLRLTAKPATLEVSWRFANGRVCGANGVERIEVAIFDPSYYEMARQNFSCNAGSGTFDELIAGEYIVEAVAESSDDAVYSGTDETSLKRGDEGQVDVELEKN